jgi:hypothetical protein
MKLPLTHGKEEEIVWVRRIKFILKQEKFSLFFARRIFFLPVFSLVVFFKEFVLC